MQNNEITLKESLLGFWNSLLKAVKNAKGLGAHGQVTQNSRRDLWRVPKQTASNLRNFIN